MKESLYQKFKAKGYDFFVGVPCSKIKSFILEIQKDQHHPYIPVSREDAAVALAVGAYFAGKKPLVFMQNSGLGNCVNIITSLLKPYNIKIHLLISLRKHPFEHEFMYKISRKLVSLLEYDNNVTFID